MVTLCGDGETVMVVDDYEDVRRLVGMRLRRSGYSVVEASNGEEAVALAERTRPALILMDLGMPVMDGYEATRRIKSLPGCGAVPVVAVSAFCDSGDRRDALRAGCAECIGKPVDLVTLDSVVLKHVLPGRTRGG